MRASLAAARGLLRRESSAQSSKFSCASEPLYSWSLRSSICWIRISFRGAKNHRTNRITQPMPAGLSVEDAESLGAVIGACARRCAKMIPLRILLHWSLEPHPRRRGALPFGGSERESCFVVHFSRDLHDKRSCHQKMHNKSLHGTPMKSVLDS